jgi:hypothetical protein
MERSACHLHLNPECPEDEVLVAIARISQVSSNAAKVIRRSDEETGSQAIHIRPLQAALDKVKSSLSPHLLSNSQYPHPSSIFTNKDRGCTVLYLQCGDHAVRDRTNNGPINIIRWDV